MDLTIGDVAEHTGLTQRTLRYYEELGLLDPPRDTGGRRRYDAAAIDRLYRIRLLRDLGTPLADVDPDGVDVLGLTRRHLAGLDAAAGRAGPAAGAGPRRRGAAAQRRPAPRRGAPRPAGRARATSRPPSAG